MKLELGRLIVVLFLLAVPAFADTPPDLALVIIEKLDKAKEMHQVPMKGPACEEHVNRLKREGEFLYSIKFPDGAVVRGIIKSWTCIKPDGNAVNSDDLSDFKK